MTGTKGKTTTSSLTAAILAADPAHPVVLGGNIGIPIVERLPELTPTIASSTSCPSSSCRPCRAARPSPSTRTSPRTTSTGTGRSRRTGRSSAGSPSWSIPNGALVLNDEDPVVASYAALGHGARPSATAATRRRPAGSASSMAGSWPRARAPRARRRRRRGDRTRAAGSCRSPSSPSRAPTTSRNALAAIAVALLFGVAPDGIRAAAAAFTGVEHRLEPVGVIDGVRFINDSQGTQPDAVAAALRAFDPPIVLIAGGRDKGIDLAALAPVVAERAVAAVLIGESGPALEASFRAAGLARTERAGDLDDAVRRADAIAREALAARPGGGPATVLLSPAAASFDMFVDYAARGRAFKAAVAALAAARPRGGDR